MKGECKPSKGGRTIWVPKKNPKPFQYSSARKKGFSTNSLHLSSSDFDDTGTLKSKGENVKESLNLGDEKKKKSLRKLGDEGGSKNHPNPNGDQDNDVGPNDDGMDQHGVTPPLIREKTSSQDVKMGGFVGGNPRFYRQTG